MDVQPKAVYHLLHLVSNPVPFYQHRLQPAAGYQPPLHDTTVSGEYNPALSQSNGYHTGIIAAVEEEGVVAHHPQPLCHLADIVVDYKP